MPDFWPSASMSRRSARILVIDDDDAVATTIASMVPPGSCEIIACRDIALAEAALDMVDFDFILVAPGASGVDGLEGLHVADFLLARNPTAKTVLLVPSSDARLKSAAAARGVAGVLDKPLVPSELASCLRA